MASGSTGKVRGLGRKISKALTRREQVTQITRGGARTSGSRQRGLRAW